MHASCSISSRPHSHHKKESLKMRRRAEEPLATGQSKRKRELEIDKEEEEITKGWSEIRLAVEELSLFQSEDKEVSTSAFLSVCNILVHVLDKIGPTMLVIRKDLQRNTKRVEDLYMLDPPLYSSLEEILKKEVGNGTAKKDCSCSRALLWLTRSIAFGLTLLGKLEEGHELRLEQMVDEAYKYTLKPWHGWISSAAYNVALKLVPDKKTFISLLMFQGQDYNALKGDIKNLISLLQPLLDETNALLVKYNLDRLKST